MQLRMIFLLIFFISKAGFSQKVDLDKAKFSVGYQVLPLENVPLEKRTYTVTSTAGPAVKSYVDEESIKKTVNLHGWKKVEKDGTVNINIDLIDFTMSSSKINEDVSETKDKAGKVTSRTVRYYATANFGQTGNIKITGPFAPKELNKKEIEAQKIKEEKVATNRFLAKTSLTVAAAEEKNYRDFSIPVINSYTSDRFETSAQASDFFRASKDAILENNKRNFVNGALSRAGNLADEFFGFPESGNKQDHLWILDTKSHPEYQAQQEAISAVKMLFATMKADEPLAKLNEDLMPLIEYFESLKVKYKSSDKNDTKIRYGAFYNLSNIYYYLDQPGLSILEANGLIANDYDKKDGEKLKKDAEELQNLFTKTKFTSRHNQALK